MKKITLLFSSFILVNIVFGQTNTFPSSGNAGIGTTSPLDKLDIHTGGLYFSGDFSSTTYGTIKFGHPSYSSAWGGISGVTNGQGWDQVDLVFYTAFGGPIEKMRLMANTGYLGIGTSSPLAKLDVRGGANFGSNKKITLNPDFAGVGELPSGAFIGTNGSNSLALAPSTDVATVGAKIEIGYASPTWKSALEVANVASGYSNLLLMKSGGNVGLGTTSPQAKLDVNGNIYSNGKIFIGTPDANTTTKIAPYSLAVNGSAVFTKAVVKLYSAWPDYVFAPTYKLTQLDSLEHFIKTNGHLPEVPQSDEVEKNGIDLGGNQAVLLKKIEELTLYIIEQNKRIEKLENELLKKNKQN